MHKTEFRNETRPSEWFSIAQQSLVKGIARAKLVSCPKGGAVRVAVVISVETRQKLRGENNEANPDLESLSVKLNPRTENTIVFGKRRYIWRATCSWSYHTRYKFNSQISSDVTRI